MKLEQEEILLVSFVLYLCHSYDIENELRVNPEMIGLSFA